MKILVVGTSYAGLVMASTLKNKGEDVLVIEQPRQLDQNQLLDALYQLSNADAPATDTPRASLLDEATRLNILDTSKTFHGLTNKGIAVIDNDGAISYLPVEEYTVIDATEDRNVVEEVNIPHTPPVTGISRIGNNPFPLHFYATIEATEQFPNLETLDQGSEPNIHTHISALEKLRALGWTNFDEPQWKYKIIDPEKRLLLVAMEVPSSLRKEDREKFLKTIVELKTNFLNPQFTIRRDLPHSLFTEAPQCTESSIISANPLKDRPTIIPIGGALVNWPYYSLPPETYGLAEGLSLLNQAITHQDKDFDINEQEYIKNITPWKDKIKNEIAAHYSKRREQVLAAIEQKELWYLKALESASESEKTTLTESLQKLRKAKNSLDIVNGASARFAQFKNKEGSIDMTTAIKNTRFSEIISQNMIDAIEMLPENSSERYCLRVKMEELAIQYLDIGEMLWQNNQLKESELWLKDSLSMLEKANVNTYNNLYASIYTYLSHIALRLGDHESTIFWCQQNSAALNSSVFTPEDRFEYWKFNKYNEILAMNNIITTMLGSQVNSDINQLESYYNEIAKFLPYLKNQKNIPENTIQSLETNLPAIHDRIEQLKIKTKSPATTDDNSSISNKNIPSSTKKKSATPKRMNPNNPEFRAKTAITPPPAAKAKKGKKNKNKNKNESENKNPIPVDLAPEKNVLLANLAELNKHMRDEQKKVKETTAPLLPLYRQEVEDPKKYALQCIEYASQKETAEKATSTLRLAQIMLRSIENNETSIQQDIKKYENGLNDSLNKLSSLQAALQEPGLDAAKLQTIKQEFNNIQKNWQENRLAMPIKRHIDKLADTLDELANNLSSTARQEGVRFVPTTHITSTAATDLDENQIVPPSEESVPAASSAAQDFTSDNNNTAPSEDNNAPTSANQNKNAAVTVVRTSTTPYTEYLKSEAAYLPGEVKTHYKRSYHVPLTPDKLSNHLRNESLALSARIRDFANYKIKEEDEYDILTFKNALEYNISKLLVDLWELDYALHFADNTNPRESEFREWRNKFIHSTDFLSLTELKDLANHLRRNYINHILPTPPNKKVTLTAEDLLNFFPKNPYLNKIYQKLNKEFITRKTAPRSLADCAMNFSTALTEFKKLGKIMDKTNPGKFYLHPDRRDALKMLLAKMGDCLQELDTRKDEDGGKVWKTLQAQDKDKVLSHILKARNKIFHRAEEDLDVGHLMQLNNKLRDFTVTVQKEAAPPINKPPAP